MEIPQSFQAISFKWKSHTHRQNHNYKIQIDENLELVHKPNQNMLTNLLWLQSTQMMQCFSSQLKLKQRFWLVFFLPRKKMCEPEIIMSYIPMEGCSHAINQREGSLGHVVPGDGGRLAPSAGGGHPRHWRNTRWRRPRGRCVEEEEEGTEGWRCRRRGRGS